MFPILLRMSGMNWFFLDFSFSNSSISSGGYSVVVKTVYNILMRKTAAPIAKAIFTDMGTTPCGAASLTPN